MKNRNKRKNPKSALYQNVVNLWEAIPRTADMPDSFRADLPPQEPETKPDV